MLRLSKESSMSARKSVPPTAVCGFDGCSDKAQKVAVVHEVPIWLHAWDSATKTWRERQTIRDWYFCSGECFTAWCQEIKAAATPPTREEVCASAGPGS
jgi:hypothetical protein